ncbi:MAG: hypothetical protein UHG68_04870 [Clostridia bacterium]|nr:hypothetical protein [Clostridia bacterium]
MAEQIRRAMPISDRAKQFAPFSALKGLETALEKKRSVRIQKRTPSESVTRVLNDRLQRLRAGDTAYVMYYTKKGYIKRTVRVLDVDSASRAVVTDDERIFFDDIYAIKIL